MLPSRNVPSEGARGDDLHNSLQIIYQQQHQGRQDFFR